MQHFTWNQENEVFLPQIDSEHIDLFKIAEELQQAILTGTPVPAQRQHLRRLMVGLEDHFTHEEWLMQSVAYPSYAWHKQQHDTVRRQLKLFVPMIEAGDREAAELFLEFLSGWLHDHTSVTDRMMGAYLRNYERARALCTT